MTRRTPSKTTSKTPTKSSGEKSANENKTVSPATNATKVIEVEETIATLTAQISTLQAQLAELTAERDQLAQTLQQTHAETAQLQALHRQEVTKLTEQLATTQQELDQQKADNSSLRVSLEQTTSQLNDVQNRMAQEQVNFGQQKAEMSDRLKTLQAELQHQLHTMQTALEQKHAEIADLTAQKQAQQEAYIALTAELTSVKAHLQQMQSHNQAEHLRFSAREQDLLAEIAQLNQQVSTLTAALEQAKEYEPLSNELRHRLDLVFHQLSMLKAEGDRLKQDYDLVLRQLNEQRALAEIGSSSINRWRHRSIG